MPTQLVSSAPLAQQVQSGVRCSLFADEFATLANFTAKIYSSNPIL